MKKTLALLLAMLMLLSALVACGNQPENPGESTTAAVVPGDTTEIKTEASETEFMPSNVPDSLKFPGTTIKFLYWSDVEREEFFVEEENGEKVHDAILRKNQRTEEQLGVTLEWVGTPGNFGNQAAFVQAAQNSVNGGVSTAYDFYASYSLAAPTIALKGLSANLADYDIIDLSKPWWPKSLVEQTTIKGKNFFVSGDLSTNLLYMMYGVFFNKDILEDVHSGENIYDIVKDGKWTLDELIRLSDGVYEDQNSDGAISYGDRFGFEAIDLHFDCFYIGSGLKNVEVDDAGNLMPSPDFGGETSIALAEKLCNFLHTSGMAWGKGTTSKDSSSDAFAKGDTLFIADRVYATTFNAMKASDVNYGILPVPKYSEDQENYVTAMAFPYTMYSMSVASPNKEAAAATLEVMDYVSYVNIKPALFDETMKARYSKEANDAIMYDFIHDNIFFELGRVFTTDLKNISYLPFRDCIKANSGSTWKRLAQGNTNTMKKAIETINSALDNLQ
ncbi:MAG: ABC transporter substrate-binding protein [Clostridia bacterium]|nr:ABC transporter substrate-binding protein [Clostridia bacterium]